jgi:hypothetical protein
VTFCCQRAGQCCIGLRGDSSARGVPSRKCTQSASR